MGKKKVSPTKEVRSVPEGEGSNLWRYLSHAEKLSARRAHFFLVAESMLFVAFAVTMNFGVSVTEQAKSLRQVTAVLGIVCAVFWWYANFRLQTRMNRLREELKKDDPVYRSGLERVEYPPSSGWVLAYLLPAATLGAWVVAWSICR